MSTAKHLLVGLPATGKTTFLAALWHVVSNPEVPGSLVLERLEGDREYLNEIAKAWLRYEPVPRTSGEMQPTRMRLREPAGGEAVELIIPDISGETYRSHWIERQWTREFDEAVAESGGVLLFIHPRTVQDPVTIRQVARFVDNDAPPEAPARDWDPERSPTQVQLVDLLQFLAKALPAPRPTPLAVIVSAWDLVMSQAETLGQDVPTAGEWIRKRLPLLHQYVEANPEIFLARCYGVSAQGGDVAEEADRDRLRSVTSAADRICVWIDDNCVADITEPIRWVMRTPRIG